ncbi:MAG: type II toxin-antitoxin system Phd/YefM family antitoxin [Verrucomicrobia bacterium]|nr:type II toxin-antitoxin system Phd/YefM family antitoxin [Verrucomicrobiota bacterium]
MAIVNIHEAKTHFSHLINQALKGDEIIIAKSGVPLVKLTPYEQQKTVRKGGQLKGILTIGKDFDDPLPKELLEGFYGEGTE